VAAAVTAAVVVGGGAVGAAPGTVHTKSGSPLTIRATPSAGSKAVGTLKSGTKVTITCQTTGQVVDGKYGRSAVWDKVGKGYISDAYVYTGSDKRVAPACTKPKPTPTPAPTGNVAKLIAAAKSQIAKGYVYSWAAAARAARAMASAAAPAATTTRTASVTTAPALCSTCSGTPCTRTSAAARTTSTRASTSRRARSRRAT